MILSIQTLITHIIKFMLQLPLYFAALVVAFLIVSYIITIRRKSKQKKSKKKVKKGDFYFKNQLVYNRKLDDYFYSEIDQTSANGTVSVSENIQFGNTHEKWTYVFDVQDIIRVEKQKPDMVEVHISLYATIWFIHILIQTGKIFWFVGYWLIKSVRHRKNLLHPVTLYKDRLNRETLKFSDNQTIQGEFEKILLLMDEDKFIKDEFNFSQSYSFTVGSCEPKAMRFNKLAWTMETILFYKKRKRNWKANFNIVTVDPRKVIINHLPFMESILTKEVDTLSNEDIEKFKPLIITFKNLLNLKQNEIY